MAKPPVWRKNLDAYPHTVIVPPRYSDLDTMGHINNVAMAGIFETARIHFHHELGMHPQDHGVRWLVAAVDLAYVDEGHFPYDVEIGCGIGAIGNRSWQILMAAFQKGVCVATCDTVMVSKGPEGRSGIADEMRAAMLNLSVMAPQG